MSNPGSGSSNAWAGAWAAPNNYTPGKIVTYNGRSWIATEPSGPASASEPVLTADTISTTTTLNIPNTVKTGDLMFAAFFGDSSVATPAGWTEILPGPAPGASGGFMAIFTKTALATDPGSPVTFASSSNYCIIFRSYTCQGIDGAPITTDNQAQSIAAPRMTANNNDEALVFFGAFWNTQNMTTEVTGGQNIQTENQQWLAAGACDYPIPNSGAQTPPVSIGNNLASTYSGSYAALLIGQSGFNPEYWQELGQLT